MWKISAYLHIKETDQQLKLRKLKTIVIHHQDACLQEPKRITYNHEEFRYIFPHMSFDSSRPKGLNNIYVFPIKYIAPYNRQDLDVKTNEISVHIIIQTPGPQWCEA